MVNAIAYFEISDGSTWMSSSSRVDFLASLGITARIFIDAENPHRITTLLELPNLEALLEALESPTANASLILEGVKMDTITFFLEKE